MRELLPATEELPYLQAPVYFDYGCHTSFGKCSFANFNFTCLDVGEIHIGDNCWLASNVVVCGGVTIGEGCVIGAGSVVTRDIPPYSLAAGNPCRVIRKITEKDHM